MTGALTASGWGNAYGSSLRLQPNADGSVDGVYRSVHTGKTGTFNLHGWSAAHADEARALAFVIDWHACLPGEERDDGNRVSAFCGQLLRDADGTHLDLNHCLVLPGDAADAGIYTDRLVFRPDDAAMAFIDTPPSHALPHQHWHDATRHVRVLLHHDGTLLRGVLDDCRSGSWQLRGIACARAAAAPGIALAGLGSGGQVCTLSGWFDPARRALRLAWQRSGVTPLAQRYLQTRAESLYLTPNDERHAGNARPCPN